MLGSSCAMTLAWYTYTYTCTPSPTPCHSPSRPTNKTHATHRIERGFQRCRVPSPPSTRLSPTFATVTKSEWTLAGHRLLAIAPRWRLETNASPSSRRSCRPPNAKPRHLHLLAHAQWQQRHLHQPPRQRQPWLCGRHSVLATGSLANQQRHCACMMSAASGCQGPQSKQRHHHRNTNSKHNNSNNSAATTHLNCAHAAVGQPSPSPPPPSSPPAPQPPRVVGRPYRAP